MTAFQKWLLWSSSLLTSVTGGVYWWMDHRMEPLNEWAVINHPLQPWVLKAHIVVAPFMVLAVGTIALDHIWKHYRAKVRVGRRSGVTMMWILAPMILSGYLIQAVTHTGWLTVLVWVHLGTGVLYALGLLAHSVVLRRRGAVGRSRTRLVRRERRGPRGVPAGRV